MKRAVVLSLKLQAEPKKLSKVNALIVLICKKTPYTYLAIIVITIIIILSRLPLSRMLYAHCVMLRINLKLHSI